MSDNAGQIAYWNDTAGKVWADVQGPLDRQLKPLGRAAMAALKPKAGERILDIGCGAGETTVELAERVAPGGTVTGVDISRPLLEVARRRGGAEGVTFVEADAQTQAFEPASFDAAFSRFGVMFFADPTAAFVNIRKALKPGGRMAFICWRPPIENPIIVLPMMAAAPLLPEQPPPPEPGAPGPFAFADPDRVRGILTDAGFEEIVIAKHDEKIGGGNLDTALDLALRIGPLGSMLREQPELAPRVTEAVRTALAQHDGPDGVKLDSATWLVTARAP